jgi:ubiquinone/menaquinone biosynthesis C-methylase UbiE
MSYDHKVIPTMDVKEWYDRIAGSYHEYHKRLDGFDHAEWRRYLPRNMDGITILDLGAGDGRTYSRFADSGYGRYIAADISEDLLTLHPLWPAIEQLVADISEDLPVEDDSIDLVTTFFTLEHVADIEHLASEVSRVLAPGGRWIFTYFPQRREYVHRDGVKRFKINTIYHRYEDIDAALESARLRIHTMDLMDDGHTIGRVYCGSVG